MKSKGFSLAETLIVIAVIAIITAIIVPVLINVKSNGNRAVAISNMHQLGLAASLYQQSSGEFPTAIPQLVDAGLVDPRLAASPVDTVKDGWANAWAGRPEFRRTAQSKPNPFRTTFITLKNFGFSLIHIQPFLSSPTAGWLVDTTIGTCENAKDPWCWHGPLMRLTFDASVIRRQEPWKDWLFEGRHGVQIEYRYLFHD